MFLWMFEYNHFMNKAPTVFNIMRHDPSGHSGVYQIIYKIQYIQIFLIPDKNKQINKSVKSASEASEVFFKQSPDHLSMTFTVGGT